jgi:hypothetical protein
MSFLLTKVCLETTCRFHANSPVGVTISANSTSNRGNNYEATKFQYRVPNYQENPLYVDPASTPRIRAAGVDSTLDHSSE